MMSQRGLSGPGVLSRLAGDPANAAQLPGYCHSWLLDFILRFFFFSASLRAIFDDGLLCFFHKVIYEENLLRSRSVW